MKAITICNPYPELIMLPETDARHKRVENRKWPIHYRGPLAIHAGKSEVYIHRSIGDPRVDAWNIRVDHMTFGAVIGVVDVVACYPIAQVEAGRLPPQFAWLQHHQHSEGPWCHVYANPRRLLKPYPCRGALGLFDVPDELIAAAFATGGR